MARIIKFPASKAAAERFAKIQVEDEIAALDTEVAEIHAKADAEIAMHGGLEGYGKMIMREHVGPFHYDWSVP